MTHQDDIIERMATMAVRAGDRSTCTKSKRGVVIFDHAVSKLLSLAWNSPPAPFFCDGSEACRAACGRVAVHAEERAILHALAHGATLKGASLLHVKVVRGEAVASGPPSCAQCSRLILEMGIARVWLLHATGWHSYDAVEFHSLSLAANTLPAVFGGVP